jgi:DNA transposition AAA+ family ATPase
MPGIEKRLSRYPQLYSRIGFAHQYRPLGDDELAFVLTRHWKRLGLALDLSDSTDAQAVAAVGRITRGNFRLIHRLFVQVERIMKINDLSVISSDVVETAEPGHVSWHQEATVTWPAGLVGQACWHERVTVLATGDELSAFLLLIPGNSETATL